MVEETTKSKGELIAELQSLRIRNAELEANEIERRWALDALRKSHEEKITILNSISDVVMFHDLDQNVMWLNKAACVEINITPEEAVGKKCYELWHKRSTPCSECAVAKSFTNKEPAEGYACTADGRQWAIAGFPVINDKKDAIGCVEIARDVTKKRKEEEALLGAMKLVENANKAKTEFMANISHELRSPMNGVLGMLDLLLDTELNDEQKDYAQTALLASEGLLEIVNDILDFSKLQGHKVDLIAGKFDVRGTVNTVLNTFKGQYKPKGLDVVSVFDANIPSAVWGDEGRLRQILFNLVGNAIKFTMRGQVKVEVSLQGSISKDDCVPLLITVSDTGIGIPEEMMDSIFDHFTQLNWTKSRKYEGTGLGLSIVKRLVKLFDGTLDVSSEVGVGSTFALRVDFKKA